MNLPLEEDVEDVLPIPLDPVTVKRLARFARLIGQHPRDVAGMLLCDLLADQDFWDAAEDHSRLN